MIDLTLADDNDTGVVAPTKTVLLSDLEAILGLLAYNGDESCVGTTCTDPYRVPMCPAIMHCDLKKQRSGRGYSPELCMEALREYFHMGEEE